MPVLAAALHPIEAQLQDQGEGVRSGRRSAAQTERDRLDQLWYVVATRMAAAGYQGWQAWHCRDTWRDLKRCIQAEDGRLIGD